MLKSERFWTLLRIHTFISSQMISSQTSSRAVGEGGWGDVRPGTAPECWALTPAGWELVQPVDVWFGPGGGKDNPPTGS